MKYALIASMLVAFSSSAAADQPDFSGEWRMDVAKSDYGQLPAPDSFIRRIEHDESNITIVEEQSGPGTTPTSTRSMKTDGEVRTQQINGADIKLAATWEGTDLIATTTIDVFGVSFKDRMSLSSDGKLLTSIVQVASSQGDIELKIVFERM